MDLNKFFNSCKIGDFDKVKYLVEHKEIDLNIKDSFDSTPLYYACLCGHIDIVKYLLQNGAKCEVDTFQGERCLYGALSDRIRDLLRNYKFITSYRIKRDPYQEFLRKIWESHDFYDAILYIAQPQYNYKESFTTKTPSNDKCENVGIKIHRAILAARSQYFYNLFSKNKHIENNNENIDQNLNLRMIKPRYYELPIKMYSSFLHYILQYLYTGQIEFNYKDIDSLIELSKYLHLSHLEKQLTKKLYQHNSRSRNILKSYNGKNEKIGNRGHSLKNKYQHCDLIITIEGETEIEKLKSDLGTLNCFKQHRNRSISSFCDVKFRAGNETFACHKVFMVNRSEYFRALIKDPFSEILDSSEDLDHGSTIPEFELKDVTPSVFKHVIRYVYEDRAEIQPDLVFDVLQAADKFLLTGLKKSSSLIIANNLDSENVLNVVLASRIYVLPNLEDACARYIAQNLLEIIDRPEFKEIIIKDAAQVLNREETDTISIVDDVKYYLTNQVQTFEAMQSSRKKLSILDTLLESIGLDA
ncbi:unnamed protein product [Gordionus sp. m RMFG-2023]|uniref:ankyrin repeat and BTB/POZ domain-containing protein 1-like n=1 Tax=Gordionus sp. m RMFG-2023 TaxID=3053472 RepID=UPI0030E2EA46